MRIAIIGAGIGGLTAAACLRRVGIDVRIYEQARGFSRLGAGIQHAPNAGRVMRALSFGRLLGYDGSTGYVRMDRSFSRLRPVLPEVVLSALLILWAAAMVLTEGAIKVYDGGAGGFVAVDGGRWVIRTLFWNVQANWFAAIAVLMAVPYLATIWVSLREPLAELPPDSYTSKW